MFRTSALALSGLLVVSLAGVAMAQANAIPVATAALKIGDSLTSFEATDDAGQPWKSADFIGKKFLVLYFYPGDFTGGCTRQAQAYRDALAKIEQLGAEVVGVSGDEVATHKLFKETYGLKHSLLSDPQGALATLLGVPVKNGGKVKALGPDRKPLLDANGDRIEITRAVTLARWTLIVDRAGKIVSFRSVANPVTDAEGVQKLVAAANQPMARIGAEPAEMAITCFALAPDGDTLALGSNDGTICLWSIAAGKVTGSINTKPKGYTGGVAFSPDGKTLAFHADDDPVRLWDLEANKESARLPKVLLAVEQLCFAPNGRQIGIVSESEGFVWNLDSGKAWKSEQPVSSLAFSPDGKTLALGVNTLLLANPATGTKIREIGKLGGRVTTLQYSPTGDHILVVDAACPGTSVRLLEIDTGEEMLIGEKIRTDRAGAGFSNDGKTIVVSNESGQLTFWNASTGEKLQTLPGTDRLTSTLSFTPDGKRLITGHNDSIGEVLIWDVPEVLSSRRAAPQR
jgi:peroxiredoxin Q/BCP